VTNNNNNNNDNNTVYVDFKNNSDTRNNKGKWNHLKIIQKLSKNILGMHVKEPRKTAVLGTAHLVRKEQNCKTFNVENNVRDILVDSAMMIERLK
jgi:hypothetical protein